MDVNRYATKKTIAQGMLDVALLTANASQLKYVLQLGPDKHPFYTLMLSLIIISIVFQVSTKTLTHIPFKCLRRVWIVSADFQLVVALFALTLNLTRDCRLYDPSQHFAADLINNVSMGCAFIISSLNIFIVGFDPTANV